MNSTTFTESAVAIDGPQGKLEAIYLGPADMRAAKLAILCHPHSLHGGSMQNKVITTLARACRDAGIASVRFNFRGVGHSAGEFANGIGETDDLLAIHDYFKVQTQASTILLAGFSFGSYVAYRGQSKIKPSLLLTIAPPVERFDYTALPLPECHWWVLQPDADEVVSPQAVYDWLANLPTQPVLRKFHETSHFFHGQIIALRDVVTESLATLEG